MPLSDSSGLSDNERAECFGSSSDGANLRIFADMRLSYDIIVVGAGHAGCEAAHAAALLGSRTLLITMDLDKIAQMSCNPAVGGIAKGQIVRELDALGGLMGIITDRSSMQFRMLNRSKGPAMWSPRSQSDRGRFSHLWRTYLEQTPNLSLWQDAVVQLLHEGGAVTGVVTAMGLRIKAKSVILTNGTFLNGLMHIGSVKIPGGRIAEPASLRLSEQIAGLGFRTDRMKTGTPMRLDGRTIHFDLCERQDGEVGWHHFSFLPEVSRLETPQRPCFLTETTPASHEVLRRHLDEAPLYNGQIHSIGPRYCPSIETKIVTFAGKDHHPLFLEPEGADTTMYYLNGFSSSLPMEVQEEAIRQIPALRDATIMRPGYAIEYDFFDPTQLHHTLETKLVEGLFFAGQINGTTGYEEAAGQGLVAGVNAHFAAQSLAKSFTLARDEAYIGVLIDDLVTKGVDEPYRMFTSRSEYRILLRQDNADRRLTPKGIEMGTVDSCRERRLEAKLALIDRFEELLRDTSIANTPDLAAYFERVGETPLRHPQRLREVILRPRITLDGLVPFVPQLANFLEQGQLAEEVKETIEVEVKYAGYIARDRQAAEKSRHLEDIRIDGHFDYLSIQSLSTEARQKLDRIRPATIGQASRIPGISPSDINILLILMGR